MAIVVFYLLFPALYSFIHGKPHALPRTALFGIVWWIAIEALCHFSETVNVFRIALERLPIFMIGIYTGKLAYEKKKVKGTHMACYILLGFLLLAMQKRVIPEPWDNCLHYPIRGALSISIMATIIFVMEVFESKLPRMYSGISSVFVWIGGLTYELYLLHQSYLILFEFPYRPPAYLLVAIILPTITAAGIFLARKALKRGN